MKKTILFFLSLTFLAACNSSYFSLYNRNKMNSLDFTNGKWLIGEIEVNPNVKDKLTKQSIKDFSEYLGERVKYSLNEKSLLMPNKIPLNPSKTAILDIKKGIDFDYFINIKCKNGKNDLSDFDYTKHNYYKSQAYFAQVTLEVYDLNIGEIIYTQTSSGSINEDNSITFKPTSNVIMSCYKRIMEDIKKKSIKS